MSAIDLILDKTLKGERLQLEDTITLFESNEIEKMGAAADIIMKRWHPEPVTTFVIGRNINYTNVCDVYCRFCAFYRRPGSEEGYVLPDETIYQKIAETMSVNGTEILMQGGTNRICRSAIIRIFCAASSSGSRRLRCIPSHLLRL